MIFGAKDLRGICQQMGVPVSFGGVATYSDGTPVMGIFDRPVQMKLTEMGVSGIASAMPSISLPFNAFSPMPSSGDTLVVDGTTYTVDPPTAEDDGAFLVYSLFLTT